MVIQTLDFISGLHKLSQILQTSLMFISGYANMKNVFYCLNITPLLRELHWLQACVDFKILLITLKILQGSAPSSVKKIISIMPASHYQ